jgi:hypothetical protein
MRLLHSASDCPDKASGPSWTLKAKEKNPKMKFVLKKDDLLVGYAFIIPFKHNNEKAQKVLSVEFIGEVNITPDDIETLDTGKRAFILNIQESGAPLSLEYQEALRKATSS